ncbi:asparaginase [Crucibulum laeve]|uniref:Asparaginase n=1 Tax=Crucibulum laeve TaxID=68775 RepID=A0A5C3LL01_9AGAR|nr:asparaginase [Crucibulum laeve]
MRFSTSFIYVAIIAFTATVEATVVKFYTERNCNSASQEFRVGCNTCIDPPGDWFAAQVSDIGPNQRVSMHNQDRCTSASQVGQWFGPVCGAAGRTALRSVWVSCNQGKMYVIL